MSDNQPEEEVRQPEPEETPHTIRLYANYTGIVTTAEELVLRFCERDFKDQTRAIEIARVVLSLPHAKRLVIAMARSLKGYEEIFGPIKADPTNELSVETKAKLGMKE